MEQSIRDSRLWLNHSWLRVYIFEHITLLRKTNNKLSNIVVVCVNLNSVHLSFYCSSAFRPLLQRKCTKSMCMSLTELSSVSIVQSNCIISPADLPTLPLLPGVSRYRSTIARSPGSELNSPGSLFAGLFED